jgi:hypothetical protein
MAHFTCEVVYRGIFQKNLAARISRGIVLSARKAGRWGIAFGRYGDSPQRNGIPAKDFAMDSARILSLSLVTLPLRVTTLLSRSWLTDTSLSPAWFNESRRLPVTSGEFAVVEHPTRSAVAKTAMALKAFIMFSPPPA